MDDKLYVKGTPVETVVKSDEIELINIDRFKSVKARVDECTVIDDTNLEHEILKTTNIISELHDILQQEAEFLYQYTQLLKRVENVWYRYFRRQLTDEQYAKYGGNSLEALTITDAKMAIATCYEVQAIKLSVDRLSRIVKYIEDQISVIQYGYSQSIGDSIKLKIFLGDLAFK